MQTIRASEKHNIFITQISASRLQFHNNLDYQVMMNVRKVTALYTASMWLSSSFIIISCDQLWWLCLCTLAD